MASQIATNINSTSPLTSIPLEVLLLITSRLTTSEFGSLRLTCKKIEELVFDSFAREFFTKRQFMITEFSLQALVDISKSRFSSSLTHVIIGLERPSLKNHRFVNAQQTLSGSRSDILAKQNYLLQEFVSHQDLITTGHDVELLAEAFSNLKSLDTIGIRDFYSRSRHRDYPNTEWRSYGVSTFAAETNSRVERPRRTFYVGGSYVPSVEQMEQDRYISRVFGNAIRALGMASSRPKHFEVILRESSIPDHAFSVPKYTESIVQPVLDNLRTLLLDVSSDYSPFHVETGSADTECPNYLLRKFLARLPELEHLRLNLRFNRDGSETRSVLPWMATPVSAVPTTTLGTSLLPAPTPFDFTKLRQLEIGMVTVEPHILLSIIRKHSASLHNISFHKVTLLQTDASKPRENLWAKFFGQLSKLDLKLTGMKMSFLAQERLGKQHHRQITFKDSRNPALREWGGSNVESCLKDFVANTVVSGPDQDTESSEDDDSDDNNSEDVILIDLVSDESDDDDL